MNTNKYILWCSCCITILIGIIAIFIVVHIEYQVTSSPVEEMYHKHLVTTLDSILNSRLNNDCYKEDINTVSANTFHTRFGGNLSPMD